jgi:hypothetical protein
MPAQGMSAAPVAGSRMLGFGSADSRQQLPTSTSNTGNLGVNVSSTVNSAVNSIGGFLRNQFPTKSEVRSAAMQHMAEACVYVLSDSTWQLNSCNKHTL